MQEDPSCQLCTVMQKFVLEETARKINDILKHPDLPQLTTLRQVNQNKIHLNHEGLSTIFHFIYCNKGCHRVESAMEEYAVQSDAVRTSI